MQSTTQTNPITSYQNDLVEVSSWPPERLDYASIYVRPDKGGCPTISISSDFGGTQRFSGTRAALEAIRDALVEALGDSRWREVTSDTVPDGEGIAYQPDAGVFPFTYCPPRDEGGELLDAPCKWFTWDGYEEISNDQPTHWMPFPKPPSKE